MGKQPSYSTEVNKIVRQISITNVFIDLQRTIEKLNIKIKTLNTFDHINFLLLLLMM